MRKVRLLTALGLVLSFSVMAQVDLALGLVAHYPFNGDAKDESGNFNDGTVYGPILTQDRFGADLSAYYFDGINNNISVPDIDLYQPVTFSCWINTDLSQTGSIYTSDYWDAYFGDYYGLNLIVSSTGLVTACFGNISYARYVQTQNSLITPSNWHNISVTWDINGNMNTYVDGQIALVTEFGDTSLMMTINSGYNDTFGKDDYQGVPFYLQGILDDIRIYNRILNEEEILAIYNETPATATLTGSILYANESAVRAGGETLVLTLTNDTWATAMGTDDIVTTELLAGISGDQSWDLLTIDFNDVVLTDANTVTITIPAEKALSYFIGANETVSISIPAISSANTNYEIIPVPANFQIINEATTVAVSGTMTAATTENDIVAGGKNIILDLTGDIWHANIDTDEATADLLYNGISGGEWDTEVTANLTTAHISRDSDTRVTITLPSIGSYNIYADETVTISVDAGVLQSTTTDISGSSLTVTHDPLTATLTGSILGVNESAVRAGGETLVLTLTNDTWATAMGTNDIVTADLLAGITGDQSWSLLPIDFNDVVLTDANTVTITIPAEKALDYFIDANETVSISIPANSTANSSYGIIPVPADFEINNVGVTLDVTGTIKVGSANEQGVRDGGYTIVLTLDGDRWVDDIATNLSQATILFDEINGGGALEWDTQVIPALGLANITMDSEIQVTINLPGVPVYDIFVEEVISVTALSTLLKHPAAVDIAVPSAFSILPLPPTVSVSGTIDDGTLNEEDNIRSGGSNILLQLTEGIWETNVGLATNTETSALISSFSGNKDWATVTAALNYTQINRDDDYNVTITLPPVSGYQIYDNETVSTSINSDAVQYNSSPIAGTSLTIQHDSITASLGGDILTSRTESDLRQNSYYLSVTVANDVLDFTVGADNVITTAILDNITGDQNWAEVRSNLDFNNVERTNNNTLVITFPTVPNYFIEADETVSSILSSSALEHGIYDLDPGTTFNITDEPVTLTVSGSMTTDATETEQDIRDGGKTIILNLTNDEWLDDIATTNASSLFNAISSGLEWDAEVTTTISTSDITRDSETQVTIILPPVAAYNINVEEVISVDVPFSLLKHSTSGTFTGSTTFSVIPLAASVNVSGTIFDGPLDSESDISSGGPTIVLELTEGIWETNLGADNEFTDSLLTSFSGNGDWTTVNTALNFSHITRTDDYIVTIAIPSSAYDIYEDETVAITVDANAVQSTTSDIVGSSLTIQHDTLSAVIEGSIIGSNESAVRAGGETIILKLRNDVWAAAMGTDDATTADLLTGITGDQNWNLTTLDFNDVVRTNDSTVTITVASPKATNYYIGADETVTVVVPASAMAHGTYALGSQTFSITNESASASFGGTLVTTNTETEIRTVGATLTIILGGDTWHANIGTSSTETTALLDAILGDEDWTTTVRPLLNSSHVTREVDNVTVTITFPDLSAYDIYANETISAILPASTLATSLSTVTVIPNITIIHNPLVAHYPFDGNPDDISGNNNHGENFGASLTNDRFGVANSAYNFDGISSRIESNLSWSVAENDEFTITVWAKTNPDIGILRHNIIHKSESGIYADVLSLAINPEYQNSSLFMRNDDPSGHSGRPRVNFSSVNTMDGNWHLFSVKRSAGIISLKIDNYPWTDSIDHTWNDGQIMTWNNIQFGCARDDDDTLGYYKNFWEGEIDDIRIYGKTLTDGEIDSLYHENGWDPLSEGLVAHYPFDWNTDDISGNNNHGTNFGATLTTDRFGNDGNAYNFDGIDNRIASNLNLTVGDNDEFTITVWAKTNPDIGNIRYNIFHKFESGIYADALGLSISPEYQNTSLFMRNDDPSNHTGRPKINFSSVNTMDGNWHLFSVKRSAGIISLKIDNYPWTDSIDHTWNDGQIMTWNNIQFGCNRDDDNLAGVYANFWEGEIDDIRFYNKALTDEEIDALYHENGWDPLSEGLVAHYPFDGNPDDISGNNNHGTNVGATPTKDRFGNENSAYLFDGIDNRVASNLDWSVGDNDEFTITVWARTNPDISNLRYRIFSKFENGSGDAFGLALRPPDESTACFIRNDNSIWSAASIDFSTVNARDGNWHLFTMKRSEGMLSLKIDNHPWKDTIDLTWYDGYIMEWYNIQIGCFRDDNNPEGYYDSFWDGEIDDIRFYQKALTDEEISSLYHENGWDPLSEGLVAHYPFNGNPDDISGNNNHGTNFGASLINDRFGNESTAYSLDGIDDKIVIPDLDLLQPASLSCWFKTDTLKNSYIFTSDFYDDFGGVHNGLALEIWEGKLYASFGEGGSARYTGINDSLITPAQWHNISVTWEDNTGVINIYIDGQIAPVSEFGNTVLTTAVNTGYEDTFGADSNSDGGPSYLFGELDDIRIYNRILNEGEIDSLYHENGWDTPPYDVTLADLLVDGVTIDGFSSDIAAYTYDLLAGETVVPTVTYVVNDFSSIAVMNVATNLASDSTARTTAVTVTGLDGVTELVYTIQFNPILEVATFAELRAVTDLERTYTVTGEVVLSQKNSYRNKKYFEDATAGIEIDDNPGVITSVYEIGDGVTGLTGKVMDYLGMLQMQPTADPGSATSTANLVEPQLITLIEFTTNFDDYEAEFVKIDGVSFTDGGGTFTNGADYSIAVGEDTTIFRIHFWDVITGTIPNNADVQGIAVSHNNEGKIAPRMQSDITLVVTPVAEFSASETEITVGDTIQFSDLSTNDPTNWEWDFGDSSSPGTIQNPEHIYSTTGNYTVSLVAANAAGSDTITKTNYITVGPVVIAPVADFMAAETVITEGNTVQFQDLSTNDPTSWIWDFGDGSSPGTLQSPSYTYSSAGTYTVSLIAANSAGPDTITKTDYITVNAVVIAPVADFSADTTIIIEGDSIQFTDITTNDPTSWTWDFGDSGSSILQNPSHTYTAVGTYTVVLVATNSAGSYTITKTDFISVNPLVIKPVADFTASETNITEGDPIQFTDLSTNEPTTWLWDFGDNGSSTEQKPLYTYTIAGTYSVSLIATNSAGADTITKTDHITVDPLVITPVADFSASETNIIEGDTVQFTDLSTNDPTTWAWDFGDSGASSEQNPEHIYTTSGTYTVVLIAENSAGPDTLTKTAHITVDPLVIKPVADFSASETNIIEGDPIQFTDLSTNEPTTWLWDFGDNGSSTEQKPLYTYTIAGTYSVSLIATNSAGADTITKTDHITVDPLVITPVADFSASESKVIEGDAVQFTDLSTNDPTGWTWDFGDGGSGTEQNPSYTYSSAGTYSVSLIVTNSAGSDTIIKTDNITVDPLIIKPVADFSASESKVIEGDAVQFTDLSTNDPTDWTWDFGDGGSSTEQNPLYTYSSAGTYSVSLIATNSAGSDTIIKTDNITVDPLIIKPAADFSASEIEITEGDTIIFTDLSSNNPTSWEWEFGDASSGTSQNPSHIYTDAGIYTVSLIAANSAGSDTITKSEYITVNSSSNTDLYIQWLAPIKSTICGTGSEEVVTVRITNTGEDSVSNFNLMYSVDNGSNYVTETYFETLLSLESIEYSFKKKADMSASGTYNCIAKVSVLNDVNESNNTATNTVTNEPMVLTIEAAHTKCNQATGGANVTVSGGTEPFDFMWTNGATTQTITELTSGIYMVSVSDANSCTKTATTTINDTGGATIQASTVVQNTSCNGSDDGFVHLSVLGGIPPYTYTWSNGSTTKDADSLAAGVYEVIVVDADDCANSQSFTISQPDIIGISIVSEGAICGSANGSATATVSGGTAPYTYDWESGAITDTANSLSGGIHNLTVTDANGCQGETKATINELGAPEINLVSVTPARCATSDGKIDISASGGNGVFQYEWSTGDVTQDLKDIAPGDYSVTVSFAEGSCYAIQVFTVPVLTPDPVPICMVTVDDELQANVIVWEKDVDKDEISEFNIYRESSVPDEYMFVATVPYEQESIYIDSNSNPRQKPWKYKMMTTDNCGNTSELSDAHTTIHLTINLGLGDEYNLIWGNYTGIVYTTYNVLRYTTVNGWETLDIVAANFSLYNSWTDMDVPATDSLFYVVEIAGTEACVSTKKATSHNSVRSNRTKSTVKSAIGIEDELNDIRNFQLWPNPNTGEFKITANIDNTDKVKVKIFDITGKLFVDKYYHFDDNTFNETIKIPQAKAGVYHLQLVGGDGVLNRMFVVE